MVAFAPSPCRSNTGAQRTLEPSNPGPNAAPAPICPADPPSKRRSNPVLERSNPSSSHLEPSNPLDALIDSLREGERITVSGHHADGWHWSGTFIDATEDHGQRWVNLRDVAEWPGLPILSLPRADIGNIERELVEILQQGDLHRLHVGDEIVVFAWEADDGPAAGRLIRRHTGVFRGWLDVFCLSELLLDQGFVEPHQIHTDAIEHVER